MRYQNLFLKLLIVNAFAWYNNENSIWKKFILPFPLRQIEVLEIFKEF